MTHAIFRKLALLQSSDCFPSFFGSIFDINVNGWGQNRTLRNTKLVHHVAIIQCSGSYPSLNLKHTTNKIRRLSLIEQFTRPSLGSVYGTTEGPLCNISIRVGQKSQSETLIKQLTIQRMLLTILTEKLGAKRPADSVPSAVKTHRTVQYFQ